MLRGELKRSNGPNITDSRGRTVKNLSRGQTRLPADRVSDLVAEYGSGVPVKELAKRYGVSRETVHQHVARQGMVRKPRALTGDVARQIVVLYESGMGLERLCQKFHVGRKRIKTVLSDAGVPVRGQLGQHDYGR